MKRLFYLLLCAPLTIQAQEQSAIKWSQGLNWQQIKAKAKKENKYIFVDCFTTWCAPCKEMDKKVYTVDSVGDYLNKAFIPVRIQMDSSKNDDATVKTWYKTASYFAKEYKVEAYPTLVFFSPAGEMVSKGMGYKDPSTVLQLARDAKDPSKQYYVLLKNYKKRKKDYKHMPFLFNTAVQLGDTDTYRSVRTDYYAYLHSLPKEKRYTKENIEFVAASLSNSNQSAFDMFYPDGREVNKVMKSDWYAKLFVDKMIEKEIWLPFINASIGKSEPDWNALYNTIEKKYNADYAGRNVLNAKIKWHSGDDDPLTYATLLNDKMEKYGSDTTSMVEDFKLFNKAGSLLEKLRDTVQLIRMGRWMEGIARRGEGATGPYFENWGLYIDNYAECLYMSGRIHDAIKWQQLAVTKGRERNVEEGLQKTMEENLALMRQLKPLY